MTPHVLHLQEHHFGNAFLTTFLYAESLFNAFYFPEEVAIGIKKANLLMNAFRQEKTVYRTDN